MRKVVARILNFPRHLSQHVGGFVLTEDRLDETVPVLNAAMDDRTFIEWDKDDIDALGLLKVDVLALGMLTCIRKALGMIEGLNPPETRKDYRALWSGSPSPAPKALTVLRCPSTPTLSEVPSRPGGI